jgi:hypothetical protein
VNVIIGRWGVNIDNVRRKATVIGADLVVVVQVIASGAGVGKPQARDDDGIFYRLATFATIGGGG